MIEEIDAETLEQQHANGRAMVDQLMAETGPGFDERIKMLRATTAPAHGTFAAVKTHSEALMQEEVK